MTKSLIELGVVILGVAVAGAQTPSPVAQPPVPPTQSPAATPVALKCTDCLPIHATATVRANVSVEAGLMPPTVAKKVFGKDIGEGYGVFLLTVSNHSADAALIIQSVFIDYSTWSLAGCSSSNKLSSPELADYQDASKPCQSASAEQGALRALLQYGQAWSWRNQLIRYLTAGGAIASSLVWRAGPNANGPKYISTITGTAIPSLGVAIPDQYIDRLNLLNDSGFRVNTVVPKQAGVVVVAFFPLDKFFTPKLKQYFFKNPSLFFSPSLLLTEESSRDDLLKVLKRVLTEDEFQALAPSADDDNRTLAPKDKHRTLRVDWTKFPDPDAAQEACNQANPSANADTASQIAAAAAAAQQAVAEAKTLLDAAHQDNTVAAQNLAAAQELITMAEARVSDLRNAASHYSAATANDVETASGRARQAADFASQAQAAATAAANTLSQIRDELLKDTPPVTVQQPPTPDLAAAVNEAQNSQQSAARSVTDSHKSAADAAQSAADAHESVIKVERLFQQFQVAVAAAARAASGSKPLSIKTACRLQALLNHLSLNTIRVVIGGEMNVDVDSIPGTIQSANFDGTGTDPTGVFAVAGDKAGTLTGLYLSGAQVQVTNATALGVKVATVSEGSTDTSLKFKLTLTKPIPSGTVIHFAVTKTKKDGTALPSGEYLYTVNYNIDPPGIDDVKATTDDTNTTTVTVSGSNYYDFNLKYTLTSNSTTAPGKYDPSTAKNGVPIGKLTPKSFELVFKSADLSPGKWLIHLTSDQFKGSDYAAPAAKTFQIPIKPTLISAKVDATGKQITVTGTGFYDLANEADMKLVFKILKTDKTTTDAKATIEDTSTVVLDLTAAATAGSDQVEVFIGKADKPAAGPTDIK